MEVGTYVFGIKELLKSDPKFALAYESIVQNQPPSPVKLTVPLKCYLRNSRLSPLTVSHAKPHKAKKATKTLSVPPSIKRDSPEVLRLKFQPVATLKTLSANESLPTIPNSSPKRKTLPYFPKSRSPAAVSMRSSSSLKTSSSTNGLDYYAALYRQKLKNMQRDISLKLYQKISKLDIQKEPPQEFWKPDGKLYGTVTKEGVQKNMREWRKKKCNSVSPII